MLSNVRKIIILRSGDDLTRTFNKENRKTVLTFLGEKKCNEAFQRIYFLRLREKTSSQISSSNLKLSIKS